MVSREFLETIGFRKADRWPTETWYNDDDVWVIFDFENSGKREVHNEIINGDASSNKDVFLSWLESHDRQLMDSARVTFWRRVNKF